MQKGTKKGRKVENFKSRKEEEKTNLRVLKKIQKKRRKLKK